MKKIKLFNRDGADLYIVLSKKVENNIYEAKLKIDKKHSYCLEYIRTIKDCSDNIESVDPSGGPFISIGDEFENNYKIVKIKNSTTFLISERNNN